MQANLEELRHYDKTMLITLDQQYFITLSLSIVCDDPNIPYSYGNEAKSSVYWHFLLAVVIGLLIGIGIGPFFVILFQIGSRSARRGPSHDARPLAFAHPFFNFTGTSACTCTACPNPSKLFSAEIRKSATVAKQWGCGFAYVPFQLNPFRRLNRGNGLWFLILWMLKIHELKNKIVADRQKQPNLGKFS